jgi:hypothetical protein
MLATAIDTVYLLLGLYSYVGFVIYKGKLPFSPNKQIIRKQQRQLGIVWLSMNVSVLR